MLDAGLTPDLRAVNRRRDEGPGVCVHLPGRFPPLRALQGRRDRHFGYRVTRCNKRWRDARLHDLGGVLAGRSAMAGTAVDRAGVAPSALCKAGGIYCPLGEITAKQGCAKLSLMLRRAPGGLCSDPLGSQPRDSRLRVGHRAEYREILRSCDIAGVKRRSVGALPGCALTNFPKWSEISGEWSRRRDRDPGTQQGWRGCDSRIDQSEQKVNP